MSALLKLVQTPLAHAVGWTLLHSLWEGAAIAVLVGAALAISRSPRLRYIAASSGMAVMLVAFAVTLIALLPGVPQHFATPRLMLPPPASAPAGAASPKALDWIAWLGMIAPWLAPVWMLGVFALFIERVMGWFALQRIRRRGVCYASEEWHQCIAEISERMQISRPVRILESCFAEVPMVVGHLRPLILMPLGVLAGFPAEQIETILMHELAHIRRADYLVNLCQRLVEALLFYHPAVWWLSSVMRTERENCCDDVVVSLSDSTRDYALALAALERNRSAVQEAVVAVSGGSLANRIRRVLYPNSTNGHWAGTLAPVLAAAIVVVAATASLQAKQALAHPEPGPADPKAPITQTSSVSSSASFEGESARRAVSLAPASRTPISILVNSDSRAIFEIIGNLAGVTVKFDPSFVSQRASIRLTDATLTQALETAAKLTGSQWTAISQTEVLVAAAGGKNFPAAQTPSTAGAGTTEQPSREIHGEVVYGPDGRGMIVMDMTPAPYGKWLNEDVPYIIAGPERDVFLKLKTDEEREQFIKAFWERRNPTPGSPENAVKAEHYRRIAYANEHFGLLGKAGWRTDRGRVYIVYGPPDEHSENASGLNGTFPNEVWRYRHIDGIGDDLVLEFVDRSGHGDFRLAPATTHAQ